MTSAAVTAREVVRNVTTWASRFSSRTLWAAGALLLGTVAGVGSAVVALNSVGLTAATKPGDWQEWNLSEESFTLPYALGHFLNAGRVPPTKASRQFIRRADDQGRALDGACTVEAQGTVPPARWWTLAAAASDGAIASDRHVLTAGQAILEANGKLIARISTSPAPGNWIVAPSRGAFVLVLTLHDPAVSVTLADMPSISQVGC